MSQAILIKPCFFAVSAILAITLASRDKISLKGTIPLQILFLLTGFVYAGFFAPSRYEGLIVGGLIAIALSIYLTIQQFRGKRPMMYLPDVVFIATVYMMLGPVLGCVFYVLFILFVVAHLIWLARSRGKPVRIVMKRQPIFPPIAAAYVSCIPLVFMPSSIIGFVK